MKDQADPARGSHGHPQPQKTQARGNHERQGASTDDAAGLDKRRPEASHRDALRKCYDTIDDLLMAACALTCANDENNPLDDSDRHAVLHAATDLLFASAYELEDAFETLECGLPSA